MIRKTCANYAIMIVLIFMGSTQLYTFIMQHRDPMRYDRAWTDTPEVKVGGLFRAHYAITRIRSCRAEIGMIMERADTNETVRRENYIGGARLPGFYKDIPLTFKLPPPSEPGCYLFSIIAINSCNEGVHIIQAPTLAFCVIE